MSSAPREFIRAEQSGDWEYTKENMVAWVMEGLPEDTQFAILIHELVEAFLCRKSGVSQDAVCKFDETYERERKEGKHKEDHEPGDDPGAPYRTQHQAATHVERAVCAAIGLKWEDHEKSISHAL